MYILVIVTVALYILSTFVCCRVPLTFVSVLGGLILLAANALLAYMAVDFFAVSINHAAPLVFAIIALSFPAVAVYDSGMWCALAVNAAFYMAARFYGGDLNEDWAFFYSALLAVASLMFPPIAWVALFLLIMNFFPAPDKPRFAVMSLAYKFATADVRSLAPAVSQYLKCAVSPYVGLGAGSAARVFKTVTLVICFAVSLAAFFRRNAEYSVSHSRVMILIFAYSAMVTLLMVLFSYATLQMSAMIILVPVSLAIYDYLVWGANDRECRVMIAFLALAVLLEYIFVAVR